MRFLFITIFYFVIILHPLFGDAYLEKILYKWKTIHGVEWRKMGEEGIHEKYKGTVRNGKPNGLGVLVFHNGTRYEGEFWEGEKNGKGIKRRHRF